VGYDRLLEENALLGELEGREKKEESLGEVLRLHKLFNKRHGRVYVQFAEPISLKTLVSQENMVLEEMPHTEYQALGRNLAYRIISAINRISVVTPQGLMASAILNLPKQNFTVNDLIPCVETYLNYLTYLDRRLSDNLEDTMHGVQKVLTLYASRKFIEWKKQKGQDAELQEQRFSVVENKRLNLEYYKNNCIHHFVPAAYTALAILSYDAFQFSASELHADYRFLQDFFKYEFAYDVDQPPEFTVRKTLKAFIQEAILIPHPSLPDTYNITSAGYRKLLFFARFLKTYFESYWVVFSVLKAYGRRELVKKERLKKIRALGLRMYKRHEIERKEALSLVNYENGLTYFTYQKIKGKEDEEKIVFYEAVIKKYLGCFSMQK
jgi:glycerol-3-phosphate O-acyltransferase